MPAIRGNPRLHPAEAKALERRQIRMSAAKDAGDKAVRDHLTTTLRAAAVKRRRKVLGAAEARNDPGPFEMHAWETVCKWDNTAERLDAPLRGRYKIGESYFAYQNPRIGDSASPSLRPALVEKQVEKPLTMAQKGKAATAAADVEKFARSKMREAMALFSLPDAEFETKMYALDSACLIISACIKNKSAKGKNLRQIFAQSEEWETQIRRMLERLDDEELQRLRDEEREHLPASFVANLLDILKYTKTPKMWPGFGTDTVKYFISKTGRWRASEGEKPEY